jgi:membrane protein implicated in regulation of membrane protease activity
LLLIQGGLLALGAFLGLIFFCIWRDRTARPFLGLFLLCSLTLNLTEIFPLSLLLAVVVRRSLPFEA